MAANLAPVRPWPRALGERIVVTSITIPLIPAVVDDLWRLRRRTKLSTTDLTNRAITSYEFLDARFRTGHDLMVRHRGTGEIELVRFA